MTRRLLPLLLGALLACGGDPAAPAGGHGGGAPASSSAAEGGGGAGAGGSAPAVARCNWGPPVALCNPYGVELGGLDSSSEAYWTLVTDVLQVHFYRPPPVFLDRFIEDPGGCAECDEAVIRGLYLVLTVRNDGGPGAPTHPPLDPAAYRAALAGVIDRYRGALALLVIEDQVTDPSSYAGTPADYLAELAIGCDAAHAEKLPCADGGVRSTHLLHFLADHYQAAGAPGAALSMLQGAKSNPDVPAIFKDGQATEEDLAALLLSREGDIDRVKAIVAGVREAGVDSVNLHWYEEGQDTFDAAIALMRASTGCNALVTGELGQRAQDAADASQKLNEANELGLGFVIWSARGTPESAPLVDAGWNLLPSGEALEQFSTTAVCGD